MRLLLGDAISLSKTDANSKNREIARRRREAMVKLKTIKPYQY